MPRSEAKPLANDEPAKARQGYSANIGLIVVVVVVMGGAMLIASAVGAGASTIIAGFTAIFFTLGVGGGSLRADLRKVAWYGPLTALSASVPRILAEYSQGAALALVCVIIFVAGLLPVLGRNYAQAGLGLGIATVLGFALQADIGSPGQTVVAAFVGVGFVVVLRVLLKLRDPSDVTRQLVAATLTDTEPALGPAYTMWLRDKPVRWLGDALGVAVGYRTLRSVLHDDDAVTADLRAGEVAAVVAAREPEPPTPSTDDPSGDAAPNTDALDRALRALDRIEEAARERDTALVPDAAATRRAFARASVRSVLTWRSQALRHALRTAVGVLLTFLVAWATVGPHDPLVTSMATASFAILQISWTQSLFKAKQRLLGVTGGAAVMAVALWLLPGSWLLPFSLLAALTGLWLIASNQVLSIGSFVVVSVGMNVVSRGLDPTRTLIEYLLLLFAGVAVGLLFGFTVVPHLRPDRVEERVRRATETTAELLRGVALWAPPPAGAPPGHAVPDSLVRPLFRMRTAVENLGSPLNRKDERAGVQVEHCAALATRFETLAIVGLLEAGEGRLSAATLSAAADALDVVDCTPTNESAGTPEAPEFVQLAEAVAAAARRSWPSAAARAVEPCREAPAGSDVPFVRQHPDAAQEPEEPPVTTQDETVTPTTDHTPDPETELLLGHLRAQRQHVLGIVEGLDEEALRRPVLPSGWSIAGLLNHLAHDDERFWFQAVVAGDPDAIAEVEAGDSSAWQVPMDVSGQSVVDRYRAEVARSDNIIVAARLDDEPRWWPVFFGEWRMNSLREVLLHVITETACHAGHLDAAREIIDGRQWMVLD